MTIASLKKIRLVLLVVLLICVGFYFWFIFGESSAKATINFFDVGQGDASLVTFPGNINVVIDGGPDNAVLAKLGESLPFYDRTIEYVILSHPHSDHFTGLIQILERYRVETFIYNGLERDLPGWQRLKEVLAEKNIKVIVIDRPRQLAIGDNAYVDFLFPDHALTVEESKDYNTGSIVNRVVFGEASFLFTGDAPQETELYLLSQGIDLESDVLKVGHQGSITSTGSEFLATVDPSYAVIMVGENSFGHPHFRTLKTLTDAGVALYRTDQDGDVVFETDGLALPLLIE